MTTKLTLSINREVIKKAKRFARNSNRSLSEIIESYLDRITTANLDDVDKELHSVLGVIKLSEDFDEKKEARKILMSKHM